MTEYSGTERDEAIAEVRALFTEIYAAWSDNDADAFATFYREDATVVMPGVRHIGRSAIRDSMAAGFEGRLKGSSAVDEPVDLRFVDEDTAIVISKAGILMAGEADVPAEREVNATWVLTKQDEGWLVAAYANAPATV
ncbi:SgcJ/EcaC family oxidoreductase [Candidatus Solirubrobacter pratensis]|uniref:SgcJ/EcaC family oxidoreductase n=1 Tax=Candidatus Solirubrobacter pratensis TaxID=1298857 RepID=UPI000406EF07|nr:SgcJ/EcaC family oxidoreductase [Candidatus Solirubrobacter pratensis]